MGKLASSNSQSICTDLTDFLSVLHGIGIFLFTKGFLLTRLVLEEKSQCGVLPFESGQSGLGNYKEGCWHPKTFDKAVVVIIDALRYDFTVPRPGSQHHFHNALGVLHETAMDAPEKAFLLPFIADPPTTTLQRLKGLTTGTLPTFIDAGSNFAGTAIDEDNMISQFIAAGKNLVHLGDDTWHSLFPGYFDANLTHAYDSFNVWDLFTVDNGVTEHIFPLLQKSKRSSWDIIFGHYLGLDHAGHRYGPDHPATTAKLQEMDNVIRRLIDSLDGETLLVVMGDHGMDVKGDHGGESDDELEAALWMYSKKGVFGRGHNGLMQPPATAKERPVGQIDLVPTLSLLLGIPIPFNNLGAPISEAFIGSRGPNWKNLALVNALSTAQINRYQQEYTKARGLDQNTFLKSQELLGAAFSQLPISSIGSQGALNFKASFQSFSDYQKETLRVCRSLWARFDIPNMLQGVLVLTLNVLVLAVYARSPLDKIEFASLTLLPMSMFGLAGGLFAVALDLALAGFYITDAGLIGAYGSLSLNVGLFGIALGGTVGLAFGLMKLRAAFALPYPRSVWGWLALILTFSQSIGFASNSYTIWEDEIMLFFISTFAIAAFASSARQESRIERLLGMSQSAIFLIATRLASLSRLCREEQMPHCRSTYYASSTSSTSAPWQLAIPLIVAAALPFIVEAYYRETRSYEGWAKLWIGAFFRVGLLGTAIFWILDAADDNNWLEMDKTTLKTIKVIISRLIIGLAATVGFSAFYNGGSCIRIDVAHDPGAEDDAEGKPKPKSVKVFGFANAHGSRYFLLVLNFVIGMIILQKPMGNGAMAALVVQILALLDIVDVSGLSQSAIGPVVLGLLGSFHFFKTGHQATLSSIQWESAFVPLSTIQYPWSPLLVVLNSFGAQIIATVAVPLIALWKQSPKKKGLLGDVTRAAATFILYHAVINLATTMWAGHLRRHLMLYRIFSPKFMTAAAVLLVVDLFVTTIAIGLVRWNFSSIAEVFGWS